MPAFFVGQRVRTKSGPNIDPRYLPMVGKEGTITARDDIFNGWIVDIDGHGTEWLVKGKFCSWAPHHLEPLVPPHEPGSWEEVDKLLPNLREKELENA